MIRVFRRLPFKIILKHGLDQIRAMILSSFQVLWFSDLPPASLNGGKEAFSKLHFGSGQGHSIFII